MSDQKTNILFVEEVKKHPLLYNTSLPDYTRRDLTEAAWDEVGKLMNLTGAACKEKWKNLRTVYSRHLRRSFEEPYEKRKKYYLTDHMNFILPYMRPIVPNHNINSQDSEDVCSGIQHNFNASNYSESLEDPLEIPGHEEGATFPFVSIKSDPSEVEDQTARDGTKMVENSRDPDPISMTGKEGYPIQNDPVRSIVENTENRRSVDPSILEARRMFLLGLVDEVAVMTDVQMRSFKRKVLKLIDEVLES